MLSDLFRCAAVCDQLRDETCKASYLRLAHLGGQEPSSQLSLDCYSDKKGKGVIKCTKLIGHFLFTMYCNHTNVF